VDSVERRDDCYEEEGQDRVSGFKTEQQDRAKRADIQTHTHVHEDTYIHTVTNVLLAHHDDG
jgi:hypothetical protein